MSRHVVEASLGSLPSGRLTQLDVELTERCDNDCIHCCINRPQTDRGARERELPASRLKKLLDEAAELGCLQVRLTGGEPLLREDFTDLYLHARRLGMRVMIFTNARRITPELADLFARVPPLLPIEVTVYGMSSHSYESISRVPGSHDECMRGLGELRRQRIAYVAKWVDLPANRHEFAAFCAWTKTNPAMKQPPAVVRVLQLRDRRDSPQKNTLIASLRRDPGDLALHLADPKSRERRELMRFCRHFLGPQGDRLFDCGFGEVPCIDAYGRLQPCLSMRAPELSFNLSDGGIREALENFFPPLRKTKATNPDYLERCARCFLKGLCEQCPARSWTEHGTLDTPVEYLCEVAHHQACQLGLLTDNERGWETADWQLRVSHMISIAKDSLL